MLSAQSSHRRPVVWSVVASVGSNSIRIRSTTTTNSISSTAPRKAAPALFIPSVSSCHNRNTSNTTRNIRTAAVSVFQKEDRQ